MAMARPRQNEHKREELLQKGMDLLSDHGYHGTGLKKILDTVAVPKGSFYNYFESKEALFVDIMDDMCQRFGDGAFETVDPAIPPVE